MLGALPASGAGSMAQLWWLGAGSLPESCAAWIVVRSRPAPASTPPDRRPGRGASGLLFTGLAWATSGDLGTLRLADLGPRLLPLLIMGVTTLGLAGMITGLPLGIGRHVRPR